MQEVRTDEAWLAIAIGSAVLLFAAIFVFGHYRREHRRTQVLRQLESVVWRQHMIDITHDVPGPDGR